MKRKINVMILLSIMLVLHIVTPVCAQSKIKEDGDGVYSYNIVENEEWVNMSREKRIAACQIPDAILKEISTENLIQSVLKYPFIIDIYAYDTYREGFLHVYEEYPALAELASRSDFASVIINEYAEIPIVKNRELLRSGSIIELSLMEILLAQPEINKNFNEYNINCINTIAEQKYVEKVSANTIYSGSANTFYDSITEVPASTLAATTIVRTPKGSSVTVYNNSGITDWSSAEISQLNNQYAVAYPNASRIANPSKKYNCHSYAWYSASANNYWMNDPSKYMTDGSYVKTTAAIVAGNKTYWTNGSHSGIVSGVGSSGTSNIKFKSKWGQLGVYNHYLWDCPYSGSISTWK